MNIITKSKKSNMDLLLYWLQKHPIIGMISSISVAFIDNISTIFSLIGIIIGVAVGALTLTLKIIELREKILDKKLKRKTLD